MLIFNLGLHYGTTFFTSHLLFWPIPVEARSEFCGRSPAENLDSIPAGDMEVCCKCCVLSGRGFWARVSFTECDVPNE